MSELTTGGINFEYPCAFRIDKEAVEKQNKALRKSIEKAFTIEELEKIRAEIKEESEKALTFPNWEYSKGLSRANEILDNHIKELKGED